ncbi:hypothetical protein GC207_01185 [bacterium]|nr:hypothetical protein [bacterium]
MDWIKKNLVFVISCAAAVIAIGVAGYYLSVEMAKYNQAGGQLEAAAATVNQYITKSPNPGHGKVDNIKAVKEDIDRLKKFESELTSTFKSIPVDATNEPAFKAELADTLSYVEKEGQRIGLTIATNFNMSFTAQKIGFRFASNSLAPLSVQLADLKEITKILVDARVNSIESYKRARVSADDSGDNAVEDEYLKKLKVTTNQYTGAVVYPYEVTFRCFSEEFGKVLEGIAHAPYSIILKTVAVEPGRVRNVKKQFAAAADVFGGGIPGMSTSPRTPVGGVMSPYGGRPGEAAASPYANARGDSRMNSRYGNLPGSSESKAQAAYGGAKSRSRPTQPGYGNRVAPSPYPVPNALPVAPPQPTGPENILTEEPIKVTLGIAVVRMPDAPADKPATN